MEDDIALGTGKPKKDKKKKKSLFGGSKSQPSDSTTNFASASGVATDGRMGEDLTPAAKLARQHTLRTKTEEARKAAAAARANRQLPPTAAYGDESTVLRQRSEIPGNDADAVDAVAAQLSQFSLSGEDSQNGPSENDQYGDAPEMTEEYDGEYDEEEGSMNGGESEDDGEYVWGRSYRDRYAVPARGILKSKFSPANISPSTLSHAHANRSSYTRLPSRSTTLAASSSKVIRKCQSTRTWAACQDSFSGSG